MSIPFFTDCASSALSTVADNLQSYPYYNHHDSSQSVFTSQQQSSPSSLLNRKRSHQQISKSNQEDSQEESQEEAEEPADDESFDGSGIEVESVHKRSTRSTRFNYENYIELIYRFKVDQILSWKRIVTELPGFMKTSDTESRTVNRLHSWISNNIDW